MKQLIDGSVTRYFRAWVAEWMAVFPTPKDDSLYSKSDLVDMLMYNGDDISDADAAEWGRVIACAIREGSISKIHDLADYAEAAQKIRPKKAGKIVPWPNNPFDLEEPETKQAQRARKLALAYRQLLQAGQNPNRLEVWEHAFPGVPAKGEAYVKAFQTLGLDQVPKAKSGQRPKAQGETELVRSKREKK
ncbi:hypothetical protein [Prosthecobacter dejongeii]|uniref:Uncharacterized protein n=1 Tax=Prosthecobacter dejongeii TaxID=48465 RepID=A0A7W8DQC1_9BACT|nr:hypothetical protein [Prosthecobacter dejongeii]MBB5038644.1 hypothetical protein [Prosthecobacter dejongeii]